MGERTVVGVTVSEALWHRWRSWFAPAVRPFAEGPLRATLGPATPTGHSLAVSMEHRDTFGIYGADLLVWLDRDQCAALPGAARRRLTPRPQWYDEPGATGVEQLDRALLRFVKGDWPESQHRNVPDAVWEGATPLLPEARDLAGTFADGSGPNCFGTVMGAAGVPDAETVWMQVAPFEQWLRDRGAATPAPRRAARCVDNQPGTVLVWRDHDGDPVHAAVTLGEGWALNKPSQGWFTPRFVWPVAEVIRQSRHRGGHLERHRLG